MVQGTGGVQYMGAMTPMQVQQPPQAPPAEAFRGTAHTIHGPNDKKAEQELPLTVLGCPDCAFLCTSNNQMCRHIFLTCHGVHSCSSCSAKLICWAFAPGVQKLFVRAKKDGVMVESPVFETAEKHQERTGHVNLQVPGKERYIKPGVPEDYGLPNSRAQPVDPTPANKYCCPQCQKYIGTWTQMTKHLDSTRHSLCKCADCDVVLKCYGMSQPLRHEKLTGHRGIVGLFRMKADYLASARGSPVVPQYGCPDCGISYLHPLHLMQHLLERHQLQIPPAKCGECGATGSYSELSQHRLTTGHESFVVVRDGNDLPLRCSDSMVSLPEPAPPHDKDTSGACRILYQCPQCLYIATSWPLFERHLYATKHTLAHCLHCNYFLPPLLQVNDPQHRAITGHKSVFGEQIPRTDYEVIVDLADMDLHDLIQSSKGSQPTPQQQAETVQRQMYQCPIDSCRKVFSECCALDAHFQSTKHGIVRCTCCEEDPQEFSVALEGWRTHTLESSTPAVILEMQKTEDDCRVWVTDAVLLKEFPDIFGACPTCKMVLEHGKMPPHVNSMRCQVNKARQKIIDSANGNVEQLVSGVLPIQSVKQAGPTAVHSAPASMYPSPMGAPPPDYNQTQGAMSFTSAPKSQQLQHHQLQQQQQPQFIQLANGGGPPMYFTTQGQQQQPQQGPQSGGPQMMFYRQ